MGKWGRYKHTTVVEHILLIQSQPAHGKEIAVGSRELKCTGCKKAKYTHNGRYRGKH